MRENSREFKRYSDCFKTKRTKVHLSMVSISFLFSCVICIPVILFLLGMKVVKKTSDVIPIKGREEKGLTIK